MLGSLFRLLLLERDHVVQRRRTVSLIALFAMLVATSCSIDGSEACGDNQVYVRAESPGYEACVCDEDGGYVIDKDTGHGCKKCKPGTFARNGSCVAPNETPQAADGGSSRDAATADAKPSGEQQPTGVDEPCESSADCAMFDATFCDTFMTHTCLIEKCATGENSCPDSWVCCDYSTLLAGLSICAQSERLVAGECPMGGVRVQP